MYPWIPRLREVKDVCRKASRDSANDIRWRCIAATFTTNYHDWEHCCFVCSCSLLVAGIHGCRPFLTLFHPPFIPLFEVSRRKITVCSSPFYFGDIDRLLQTGDVGSRESLSRKLAICRQFPFRPNSEEFVRRKIPVDFRL